MNTGQHIAILIMAAGESSRMKGIKQLLPWKGTNLLLHTLNTLLKVQKEKVFVVLGANEKLIRTESNLGKYPISMVINQGWKDGLGTSIARGINVVLTQEPNIGGILVCLADQPLLTADYYKELIWVFKTGKPPIVATKYPNKYGVPAIFETDVAKELIHLKEDYGARYMMSKYKEEVIALDAGELITDIDTPETYALLYKQHNVHKK